MALFKYTGKYFAFKPCVVCNEKTDIYVVEYFKDSEDKLCMKYVSVCSVHETDLQTNKWIVISNDLMLRYGNAILVPENRLAEMMINGLIIQVDTIHVIASLCRGEDIHSDYYINDDVEGWCIYMMYNAILEQQYLQYDNGEAVEYKKMGPVHLIGWI